MTSKSIKSITSIRRSKGLSREKRSSVCIDFSCQFKKACEISRVKIIPNVKILTFEPGPADVTFPRSSSFINITAEVDKSTSKREIKNKFTPPSAPPDVMVTYNANYENSLNSVIFRNLRVQKNMLTALKNTFTLFPTVVVLKLVFCGMNYSELQMLRTILLQNRTIKHLHIDGNPNKYQNFYMLLKNTKLETLSMRCCKINDRGIAKIAEEMSYVFDQPLIAINLASNFITDEGVVHVADALRINRCLLSLNLADNWLTDAGCIAIINVLQKFALKHEEIVIRRKRNLNYLVTLKEMIWLRKQSISEMSINSSIHSTSSLSKKLSTNSKTKSGKRDSKGSHRKSSKGHSSTGSKKEMNTSSPIRRASTDLENKRIENEVVKELGIDNHPFIMDCYPENKKIYCKGNFKLTHLNLAYNKIDTPGLASIVRMLKYQRNYITHIYDGISRLVLQGNLVPDNTTDLSEIYDLVLHKCYRRSSSVCKESYRSLVRRRSSINRIVSA